MIDRFGLNSEDIEKHALTWIENLRTGSGREARDEDYIFHYGRKKCECNALFKNDETLEAAEQICREALEKYYGSDALDRFREKEETMKQRFNNMLEDPLWKNFYSKIDELTESIHVKKNEDVKQPIETVAEREVAVDNKTYGRCPICGYSFDYSEDDVDRLLVCRSCGLPMRLRWKGERKHE